MLEQSDGGSQGKDGSARGVSRSWDRGWSRAVVEGRNRIMVYLGGRGGSSGLNEGARERKGLDSCPSCHQGGSTPFT